MSPLHIEGVTVNRRSRPWTANPVCRWRGEVQIDYAALSYLNAEKVRYKYSWGSTPIGGRRNRSFAYYTNLPPAFFVST